MSGKESGFFIYKEVKAVKKNAARGKLFGVVINPKLNESIK